MAQKIPTNGSPRSAVKFRMERFVDGDANNISLIKIGEYVRTPLYEPSIRAMRLPLSEVRKQLDFDRKTNEIFNKAWKAAGKLYHLKSAYLKAHFKGPEEYCLALICYTLDEPYKIYEDFNKKCQQLVTDSWTDFPYKSLLYLLIQAEMRMRNNDDENKKPQPRAIHYPITITTDLDYSIEEEKEVEVTSEEIEVSVLSPPKNNAEAFPNKSVHRVYRGYEFAMDDLEFKPRNLVAFNHLIPATSDGLKLEKSLENLGKRVTLLEIDQVSWSSKYIASLSVFPVEKEVIIWPWIKFYVEERKMIGKNIEKIILKPTSQSFTGNSLV